MTSADDTPDIPHRQSGPRQLTRAQRRVLGVLIEKAMTTPDQYPLTLKSLTSGCNQKSNRDPITSYSEEQVQRFVDELRALGLVAVVHTESGRTERYRHYVRKAYPFDEPQLAIVAELWLRGRQQLGELRGRASRMAPMDSLEQLRTELSSLLAEGFIQASGGLDRRGIEVDHNFYLPDEGRRLQQSPAAEDLDDHEPAASVLRAPAPSADAGGVGRSELAALELRVETLEQMLSELRDNVERLQRELGVA